MRRRVSPVQVVAVLVLVVVLAGFIGWKLTYGKKPETMKRIPRRVSEGMPGASPTGGDTSHAVPRYGAPSRALR